VTNADIPPVCEAGIHQKIVLAMLDLLVLVCYSVTSVDAIEHFDTNQIEDFSILKYNPGFGSNLNINEAAERLSVMIGDDFTAIGHAEVTCAVLTINRPLLIVLVSVESHVYTDGLYVKPTIEVGILSVIGIVGQFGDWSRVGVTRKDREAVRETRVNGCKGGN
jgi:hypothetical protein